MRLLFQNKSAAKTLFLDNLLHAVINLQGTSCNTACAGTDQDLLALAV